MPNLRKSLLNLLFKLHLNINNQEVKEQMIEGFVKELIGGI